MSSGHKTSAIARPRRRPTGNDDSRFADFTRPIREARQLVRKKGNRWTLFLLAVVVIAALLGALFVLPVQAWLRQEDDLAAKRSQLAILEDANAQLSAEVDHLETVDGAKEAARDELGLVEPGEIRVSMLDLPNAPAQLPAGWPYDAVTQIVHTRAAQLRIEAATETSTATTAPPLTAPSTTTPPVTIVAVTTPVVTMPLATIAVPTTAP